MKVEDNYRPYAVLPTQMSGVSFLLSWHVACMNAYLLSEPAGHGESSDLPFGLTGPRAQPCCLQNLDSQPRGTEVRVLRPWASEAVFKAQGDHFQI